MKNEFGQVLVTHSGTGFASGKPKPPNNQKDINEKAPPLYPPGTVENGVKEAVRPAVTNDNGLKTNEQEELQTLRQWYNDDTAPLIPTPIIARMRELEKRAGQSSATPKQEPGADEVPPLLPPGVE